MQYIRGKTRIDNETVFKAHEMYLCGKSLLEISEKIQYSKITVWNGFKRLGLNTKLTVQNKIKINSKTTNNGCVEWTGCTDAKGYGVLGVNKKNIKAHRISYEMTNGKIPDGLVIRHKCDNKKCINPNHLETGTNSENINDRELRGRGAKYEKHGMSKLTNSDVLAIRRLLLDGKLHKDISEEFKISMTTISFIKNKKLWNAIY